jgi:hypothetical protein
MARSPPMKEKGNAADVMSKSLRTSVYLLFESLLRR